MKYLLSVDGGGTKTEFCVSDLEGNVKGSFYTASSNYKSVGIHKVYSHLKEGIRQIEEVMKVTPEEIAYSVWGISGCDSESDYEMLSAQIRELGFKEERFMLCNDALLAFYAQADEPGIVIISGTGSIVMGISEKGETRRAGGWGYNISDTGSGYWIGNEAVRKTLLYCDGCLAYSPLFDAVRELFGAETFKELPYRITEITDYFEIAKAALLVTEFCSQGDKAAGGILKEGARVLAKLVKSVYDRLDLNSGQDFSIVFSGGVLKSEEYRKQMKEALRAEIPLEHVNFAVQKNAPVYGGINLAGRILDWSIKHEGKRNNGSDIYRRLCRKPGDIRTD